LLQALTSSSTFDREKRQEEGEEPNPRRWQHLLRSEKEEFASILKKTSGEVDQKKDLQFQVWVLQFPPWSEKEPRHLLEVEGLGNP